MLRIVIGRSGSGKSQKCITEFNTYIQNNIGIENFSYLFVPEQYNMITERRLLEYQKHEGFKVQGLIGHEVLNFKRFTYRILSIYGNAQKKILNESGKIMLLKSALNDISSNLQFYKNINKKNGEIARILSLIEEFSKYNVSFNQLKNIKTEDHYFNKKIQDLSLIYEKYQSLKNNIFSDDNDSFKIMINHIKENYFFAGKSIWIDSFTGFTAQELDLIKIMMVQCKAVTVTLCTDLSNEPAFSSIDKTLDLLINAAKENSVEYFIDNLSLNPDSNKYKYNNNSIFLLQKHISKARIDKEYESKDIKLTQCDGAFDEIINCALKIKKLHDEDNISYKNIAVATRNPEGYDVLIKSVFRKYNIPFYIDDKSSIENNPLIKTILGILSIISDDWQMDDVLECIKSDLLYFVKDKDTMENLIISNGLKGKRKYEKFNNFYTKALYENINELTDCVEKANNIKEACIVLCDFFEKWGFQKQIEKMTCDAIENYDIKNEYSRIWNIFIEVIEQIAIFLGNNTCNNAKETAQQLKSLLGAGFSQYKIGFLPGNIDSVQIINIERSRSSEIKALFVLGLNDGIIPANFNDNGVLKDTERSILNKFNIYLADNNDEKALKENYYIYTVFSLPTDYLEISWALSDIKGKSLRPSNVILRKIIKLFPNVKINNYKFIDDRNLNALFANNEVKIEENINNSILSLNGTLTTTVSRIENYYKCPYSFLLNYAFKLQEREEADLNQSDFGNIIHDIAKEISTDLSQINNDAPISEYEKLVNNAYEKINEKYRFSQYEISNRDKVLILRLSKFAAKSFMYIKKQIDAGKFKTYGYEVPFGYDEDTRLDPIIINTNEEMNNLNKIKIVGRIDRFDVMEDENGQKYVRVIDYKTSQTSSKITEEDIKAGVALQLITYLNAISNSAQFKDSIPAAALYYTFDDDISKISCHVSIDKKLSEDKLYCMKGFVLDDEAVVDGMTGGKPYVIGGTLNDGKLKINLKNIFKTKSEFEEMKNVVFEKIEKASLEISNGNYPVKPYENKDKSSCLYCKFKSICAKCAYVLD